MEPDSIAEGLIFVLMLLLAGVFSIAELAFASISRSSLEKLCDEGVKNARWILRIYRPKRKAQLMLATGKGIALVVATGVAILFFSEGPAYSAPELEWVVAGGFSLLCFLFVENVFPRIILKERDETSILRFGRILIVAYFGFWPLTTALDWISGFFAKELDSKEAKEEELKNIVESESEEGVIEENANEMIQGILEFSETTVREVMVPRIDMVCVEESADLEQLVKVIEETGHSRIPVYRNRIDDLRGIIYAKDLIRIMNDPASWNLQGVLREACFVPESKKIAQMLSEFRRKRIHLAIVVDEYGGTAGLVTMEDLIEEIVGEIQDEYDEEEQFWRWLEDGVLWTDARIDIHDLNELLDAELPTNGYKTLGGLIYERLGRIPEKGEVLTFEGLSMCVESVSGHRISKVKIVKEHAREGKDEEQRTA
ncbi:MAG: hemolysin family protein [Candidatus Latescibacterota bacterium]